MIKISKCGFLYTKSIERWQINNTTDKRIWEIFCKHLIAEYKNLLSEGGSTTLDQEEYGKAFNATELTTLTIPHTELT